MLAGFQTHSIRFPKQLLAMLKIRALVNQRSLAGEVIYILNQALERTMQEDEQVARLMKETMRNSNS